MFNEKIRLLNIFINDNFLLISLFAAFTINTIWNIFRNLNVLTIGCIFWFIILIYNNKFIIKDDLYCKGKYDGENGIDIMFNDKLYCLGHTMGLQKRMKMIYEEYGHWDDEK